MYFKYIQFKKKFNKTSISSSQIVSLLLSKLFLIIPCAGTKKFAAKFFIESLFNIGGCLKKLESLEVFVEVLADSEEFFEISAGFHKDCEP
jgi:hypothetical protein